MALLKRTTISFNVDRLIEAMVENLTDEERAEIEGLGEPHLLTGIFGGYPIGLVYEKSL